MTKLQRKKLVDRAAKLQACDQALVWLRANAWTLKSLEEYNLDWLIWAIERKIVRGGTATVVWLNHQKKACTRKWSKGRQVYHKCFGDRVLLDTRPTTPKSKRVES